jgi:hypothetical protein
MSLAIPAQSPNCVARRGVGSPVKGEGINDGGFRAGLPYAEPAVGSGAGYVLAPRHAVSGISTHRRQGLTCTVPRLLALTMPNGA